MLMLAQMDLLISHSANTLPGICCDLNLTHLHHPKCRVLWHGRMLCIASVCTLWYGSPSPYSAGSIPTHTHFNEHARCMQIKCQRMRVCVCVFVAHIRFVSMRVLQQAMAMMCLVYMYGCMLASGNMVQCVVCVSIFLSDFERGVERPRHFVSFARLSPRGGGNVNVYMYINIYPKYVNIPAKLGDKFYWTLDLCETVLK